jgi:hypothetical protein
MWIEPVFAILVYVFLIIYNPNVILIAIPFLIFWMAAPLIAFAINRPLSPDKTAISEKQTIYLRTLARKIWGFFENFVTAEDNWLPPDNYQEEPVERIAHRTSPTNIGLSLLSNLTAYDFGYITMVQFIERTSNTINTMQRMERYRGHLYNWYDTISLVPLFPKYISSVDSGNLAAHLITLKQGLLSLSDNKIVTGVFFKGLSDTVSVLIENANENELLVKFREHLNENYQEKINTLGETKNYIEQLESSFTKILTELQPSSNDQKSIWAQKVLQHLTEQKNHINALSPWLLVSKVPLKFEALFHELPSVPTLKTIALIEQDLLQKIISYSAQGNSD